jgi:hypothetical protein
MVTVRIRRSVAARLTVVVAPLDPGEAKLSGDARITLDSDRVLT